MDLNCVLRSWLGCGINVKKGLHVCVFKRKGDHIQQKEMLT